MWTLTPAPEVAYAQDAVVAVDHDAVPEHSKSWSRSSHREPRHTTFVAPALPPLLPHLPCLCSDPHRDVVPLCCHGHSPPSVVPR